MSEETENEERRLQGLGEIPEGREDPGEAFWSPEPDPLSGEAIDLIAQQTLRPDVPGVTRDFDTLQAEQDSIQVGGEVKSVYEARPINGFDTLIGGVIEMIVPGPSICTLLSEKPVAPFTFDFGAFTPNDSKTETDQTITGCNVNTYAATIDSTSEIFINVWDITTSPGEYNFYLFDPNGDLEDSILGSAIGTNPFNDIFEVTSPSDGEWVLAIQGVESDDISNATVNVRFDTDSS